MINFWRTKMDKEHIDGFLLGDGGIQIDKRMKANKARAICGLEHEEFCRYLIKPFGGNVRKYNDKKMKQGFRWQGFSKFTEELYKQYLRWYPEQDGKRLKQVPEDVELTPTSIMMWYLGDGSLVTPEDHSSVVLRLSTDGFRHRGVEHLVSKLNDMGILCHRNNENRIVMDSRGIPAFFDFIGRKSPVSCYDYKFALPEWRFESKRMKEVAEELGVNYNRLAHLVKIGKIETYRLSENGRPRFLPEHIKICREMIKSGELY